MSDVSEISERELALLCEKGDSDAIRELYSRYAARLRTLCSRYSGGSVEGMDLMHDTLVKALRKIGQFRYVGKGSLYAWLSRIAVNLAIDRMRKEGKLEALSLHENLPDIEEPSPEDLRSVPLEELQRMISVLPDAKRVVFNMFCMDGYSHKEIAAFLGISEKTSSSTLAKAKKDLISMINEYLERNK